MMINRRIGSLLAVLGLTLATLGTLTVSGSPIWPQSSSDAEPVPQTMTYQGYLTDRAGAPVNSKSQRIVFRLYAVPSGGRSIWEEDHAVTVVEGVVTAVLGAQRSIVAALNTSPVYLGIEVVGSAELTLVLS